MSANDSNEILIEDKIIDVVPDDGIRKKKKCVLNVTNNKPKEEKKKVGRPKKTQDEKDEEKKTYVKFVPIKSEKDNLKYKQYSMKKEYFIDDYLNWIRNRVWEGENERDALYKASGEIMDMMAEVIFFIGTKLYFKKNRDDRWAKNDKDISLPKGNYGLLNHGCWYISYKDESKEGGIAHQRLFPFHFLDNNSHLYTFRGIQSIPFHEGKEEGEEEEIDSSYFNIFPGFVAEMIPDMTLKQATKKCKPLLDHIFKVWANSNEEAYKYILEWVVYPIRYLKKSGTLLNIIGPQGCGKSMIWEFIRQYVCGSEMFFITSGFKNITCKFNTQLANKLFIVINEADNSDGKTFKLSAGDTEKMKGYITDETINIEGKGKDIYELINYINWVYNTNHEDTLSVDERDRRTNIFKTTDEVFSEEYFTDLRSKINNNDMGDAFYTFCRLSEPFANISKPFNTEAREEAKKNSKAKGLLFFEQVFLTGEYPITYTTTSILDPEKFNIECITKIEVVDDVYYISKYHLYESYKAWWKHTHNGIFWSDNDFDKKLNNVPYLNVKRKQIDGGRRTTYVEITEDMYSTITFDIDRTVTLSTVFDIHTKKPPPKIVPGFKQRRNDGI